VTEPLRPPRPMRLERACITLVADVNGDGLPDLVVINNSSNTFSVLNGNGDGTFKASVDFVAG